MIRATLYRRTNECNVLKIPQRYQWLYENHLQQSKTFLHFVHNFFLHLTNKCAPNIVVLITILLRGQRRREWITANTNQNNVSILTSFFSFAAALLPLLGAATLLRLLLGCRLFGSSCRGCRLLLGRWFA